MKIFRPAVTHPTFADLVSRFFKILARYGFSTKKMETNLKRFLTIFEKHGVVPSLPITAKVLSKYPQVIKGLIHRGVEFGVHGYEHVDYTLLPQEELPRHFQRSAEIFQQHEIPFSGFRFPYLRHNPKCFEISDDHLFKWDSSQSILWDVFKNTRFPGRNWRTYQAALRNYDYTRSDTCISLPRFLNHILEIPVSLPDDDLLIDRLGVKDENVLNQIWGEALRQTRSRGELYVLQLHPERVALYEQSLKTFLQSAQASEPKLWMASLNAIYEWWTEKRTFRIDLLNKGHEEYGVHAHCSKRASILIQSKDPNSASFFKRYRIADQNHFTIKSAKRPVIGIPNSASPGLIKFLQNEGFAYETSPDESSYVLYLEDAKAFDRQDEIKILQRIDHSEFPLIRFWRWPDRCQSAMAVTGDIDALTSLDFFLRLL